MRTQREWTQEVLRILKEEEPDRMMEAAQHMAGVDYEVYVSTTEPKDFVRILLEQPDRLQRREVGAFGKWIAGLASKFLRKKDLR